MSKKSSEIPKESGEKSEVPEFKFTDNEKAAIEEDSQLLSQMAEMKRTGFDELDGMDATQYYTSNHKKDLSYIPPKKNKGDIRIVTGTTREKGTTLLSTMLNLNAEPDVTAFDKDDLIVADAGNDMGDLIKKTRQVELWERQRPIIYREMIAQGDVFLEDTFVEEYQPQSFGKLDCNPIHDEPDELVIEERLRRLNRLCKVRMHKQPNVYVSDPHEEYIDRQDVVALGRVISRQHAASLYSQWKRWGFVPYTVTELQGSSMNVFGDQDTYNPWTILKTNRNQVSELKTFNVRTNRHQIYLNGIPMLPCNYQLTRRNVSGNHPLIQGKLEPISGFWLGKGVPAKTKVEQEVLDELTGLMVGGVRQSRKPPLGTTSKKVYSGNIFDPGRVTQDIKEGTFHHLLPANSIGPNPAEFSFYNLIKESINEKTTNEVYGGGDQKGIDTLGQAQMMQEQQLVKLGSALDAVTNLERSMAWARIETIMSDMLSPKYALPELDEGDKQTMRNVYEQMSVETTVENGKDGIKLFKFSDKEFPTITDQAEEEDKLSKQQGKPVRITYINPDMLRKARYKWYITVNPTPKSTDRVSVMMFINNIKTAVELFGPESLNLDYLKQRYATMINEDYSKMFQEMDVLSMMKLGMSKAPGGGAAASPAAAGQPTDPVLQ